MDEMKNIQDISFIDDMTVEDVMVQMINDFQEKYKEITGKETTLGKADPYRMIMYACTMQIYQCMQYADYAAKMGLLRYSREEYLDHLAALRGIARRQPKAAVTKLKFSIASSIASAISIPAGTRVTNGNGVYFSTNEYAEIKAGETEITIPATCTVIGIKGNDLAVGEISKLVNTLPYIESVTNIETSHGGRELEDDESLRERTFQIPNAYSTAGPDEAYKYHVMDADESIKDVVVSSPSAGVVDIRFICEGGELPDKVMIQKVEEYLSNRKVRPLTDRVVIREPETTDYNISLTYFIPESRKSSATMIRDSVETAIEIYNNWQTEKIGRDINPYYLIQKIMEIGVKRVDLKEPAFQVVGENVVARKGKVNITYGGVEHD